MILMDGIVLGGLLLLRCLELADREKKREKRKSRA